MKKIYLNKECISRLQENSSTYEVMSSRVAPLRIGLDYRSDALDDVFVRCIGVDTLRVMDIGNDIWDAIGCPDVESYVKRVCGRGTWELNDNVRVVSLCLSSVGTDKSSPQRGLMRKVSLSTIKDEGSFISLSNEYVIGEVVASNECYSDVVNRDTSFRKVLCDHYGIEDSRLNELSGWHSRKWAEAEVLPRKIRVVSGYECPIQDVKDEDWNRMGVEWLDGLGEERTIAMKRGYLSKRIWDENRVVRVYRYETVCGAIKRPERPRLETYEEFLASIKRK